jgi:calpain-7
VEGNSSVETDIDEVWRRVLRGWRAGEVIVTVGTGSLTPLEEKEWGLVGDHNYSVFGTPISPSNPEMVHVSDKRLVKLRNPWSQGGIPKPSLDIASIPSSDLVPGDLSLGTFWFDFYTLTQVFKTLYLNWTPSLFPHFQTKHFTFTPNGSDFDVSSHAQYTFRGDGPGEVWLLLERHYLGQDEGWGGYIGLAVFSGAERLYCYGRPKWRVPQVFTT